MNLEVLANVPIYILLILSGIVFLILAMGGSLTGIGGINTEKYGKFAFLTGGTLVVTGILTYIGAHLFQPSATPKQTAQPAITSTVSTLPSQTQNLVSPTPQSAVEQPPTAQLSVAAQQTPAVQSPVAAQQQPAVQPSVTAQQTPAVQSPVAAQQQPTVQPSVAVQPPHAASRPPVVVERLPAPQAVEEKAKGKGKDKDKKDHPKKEHPAKGKGKDKDK